MDYIIIPTGDIKNIYWYSYSIIALTMEMFVLVLMCVVRDKYSRTKMLNCLSLAPLYAILVYFVFNVT